jgi:hypothetical protein
MFIICDCISEHKRHEDAFSCLEACVDALYWRTRSFYIFTFTLNYLVYLVSKSRDGSVGIVTGYGLDGWGSIFLSSIDSETGFEAHPVSYPVGTGGSFTGGKAVGA